MPAALGALAGFRNNIATILILYQLYTSYPCCIIFIVLMAYQLHTSYPSCTAASILFVYQLHIGYRSDILVIVILV